MAGRRWRGVAAGALGAAMLVASCALPGPALTGVNAGPVQPIAAALPAGAPEAPQLTCPQSIPAVSGRGTGVATVAVPSPPMGFDGSARLVPRDAPASAVLCRYATKQNSEVVAPGARDALNGAVPLRGDLGAVVRELSWVPRLPGAWSRGCTAMGGPMRATCWG